MVLPNICLKLTALLLKELFMLTDVRDERRNLNAIR